MSKEISKEISKVYWAYRFNKWLTETAAKMADPDLKVRPKMVLKSGLEISVQASDWHYCTPRSDFPPYTAVEIGFPRFTGIDGVVDTDPLPESFNDYWDGFDVYAYVPVDLVVSLIAENGGF